MVKNLPANARDVMQVQSLGREDPLEEEMATHSSILALGNPRDGAVWWATIYMVIKDTT